VNRFDAKNHHEGNQKLGCCVQACLLRTRLPERFHAYVVGRFIILSLNALEGFFGTLREASVEFN